MSTFNVTAVVFERDTGNPPSNQGAVLPAATSTVIVEADTEHVARLLADDYFGNLFGENVVWELVSEPYPDIVTITDQLILDMATDIRNQLTGTVSITIGTAKEIAVALLEAFRVTRR